MIGGPLSDQPDRQHGNQLKADRTRDDVCKKLGQCVRRRISTNFLRLFGESENTAS